MARANLIVSEELKEKFQNAQDGSTRWIQISIENEHFQPVDARNPSLDEINDFNSMKEYVNPNQASLFTYCKDTNASALRWVLVAYVPDTCSVRDKMLYSSSREGLKKQLGHNYFVGEYHVVDKSELSYSSWTSKTAAVKKDVPLSEAEILKKEQALLETDTSIKSSAMSVVPFTISDDLSSALKDFKEQTINWVEMELNQEKEIVELSKKLNCVADEEISSCLDMTMPRFVAYHRKSPDVSCFIFSCPEETSIRAKMMNSTCKATILAYAKEMGLDFKKIIEIRDANDLLEITWEESSFSPDQNKNATGFSRPCAPGRGRRGRGNTLLPKFQ